MPKQLFVKGIGTEVGKTIVSAILTEVLQADYWKPIQSGDLDSSDSLLVKSLTSPELKIHQERYRLQKAASPHQSAKEDIEINLNDFEFPKTTNFLIVEGAGGLFVPINEEDFMIDLIQQFNLPTVVVATNYLGCINHTLLTIEILKLRNIAIEYFVFNGEFDEDTARVIKNHLPSDISIIIIPKLNSINSSEVKKIAETIKHQFNI
ncbi:dethiobiotin synthase [Empedobacter falsenii]|uniref:dethiobiotin synthase n=1 Tax=Empedobacter falsenii TaxID=343874 RepID=UPI001C8DA36E|nr:dethiobiotin synthase [Empedobacter falsenii]MBY0067996.1 dethiobiotin synthase [Empedobacter falsenii]